MDIFEETKEPLKAIWDDELKRQQSKIVIFKAIADCSDITAKEVDEIMNALDNLLLDEEDYKKVNNPQR